MPFRMYIQKKVGDTLVLRFVLSEAWETSRHLLKRFHAIKPWLFMGTKIAMNASAQVFVVLVYSYIKIWWRSFFSEYI